MEQAVALIDLLGFSEMVKANPTSATNVLNDFYNICFNEIKGMPSVKGHLFSDSLLCYSGNKAALLNSMTSIYRKCLAKNENYRMGSKFFLLPRGGISVGIVNIEERTEPPNLTKNFIVSPALVHSATMEREILGSRLLVAVRNDYPEENEILWNNRVKTILYLDEAYDFWEKYVYSDALWFADLALDPNLQRREIRKLLEITTKLVKENSSNPKFLAHHIETLRIGLLSYSRFFEGAGRDNLIESLIEDFSGNKYWKIWISMIEMAMQSPDNWAVPAREDVVTFYKKVGLSKGWVNVLREINHPKRSHLKKLFYQFVNEMKISIAG